MATISQIHWYAPATIIIALVLGVLFSLGHHLFYQSLAGTEPSNNEYDFYVTNVSPQQLNTSAGTAFAFLVNFTLVAAISTGYIQLFWRSMIYRGKDASLDALDTTFSALGNIFAIFKVKVWYRHPLLFLVVCCCWLIPIASVVTPGTLSVESRAILPALSSLTRVPTLGLDSLNFLSDMQGFGNAQYFTFGSKNPNNGQYLYQGPSRPMENVALQVGTNGKVMSITPPNLNSTWELDFHGPGISCSSVQGKDRQAILENVARATNNMGTTMYTFMAWTYTWDKNTTFMMNDHINSSVMLPFDGNQPNVELVNPGAAMPPVLYVAVLPCEAHEFNWTSKLEDATFTKCQLVNTTYHSEFTYVNGGQSINTTRDTDNDKPITTIGAVAGPGYGAYRFKNCTDDYNEEFHKLNGPLCSFDKFLARTLSYQAIFDAFSQLVLGSVTWQNYMNPIVDTNMLNTVLIDSPEMSFVRQMHQNNLTTLQNSMLKSNSKPAEGFVYPPSGSKKVPLAKEMENLFQNIVISAMASPTLQSDAESEFAPPLTKVTYHNYHNEYVYSASKLWIAYGIAIFIATVISVIGIVVIFANGASHSFDFSSIFRFAWGATISVPIKDEDANAHDPLPAYLAAAEVRMGSRSKKEHDYEEVNRVDDGPPQLPPVEIHERTMTRATV